MFYIFCDAAIAAAIAGTVLSIASDLVKKKRKRVAKISNAFGYGFVVLTVATTVCFFAGF